MNMIMIKAQPVFDHVDQENALNGITAGIFGATICGSRLYIQATYTMILNKLIDKANPLN